MQVRRYTTVGVLIGVDPSDALAILDHLSGPDLGDDVAVDAQASTDGCRVVEVDLPVEPGGGAGCCDGAITDRIGRLATGSAVSPEVGAVMDSAPTGAESRVHIEPVVNRHWPASSTSPSTTNGYWPTRRAGSYLCRRRNTAISQC